MTLDQLEQIYQDVAKRQHEASMEAIKDVTDGFIARLEAEKQAALSQSQEPSRKEI